MVYLTFFSLQLAETMNKFEVVLAAREEKYKKWFAKCFLNAIYLKHLEILHCSSFFILSKFLFNNYKIFS